MRQGMGLNNTPVVNPRSPPKNQTFFATSGLRINTPVLKPPYSPMFREKNAPRPDPIAAGAQPPT
jgi:hypothetical protein